MNILLMGLRGSGKTTVGRLLAQQSACSFVDLDERVLATFDETTVSEVWSAHGEGVWRAAEARVLEDLLATPAAASTVIALGGGTPTIEAACVAIEAGRAAGSVSLVYLRCDAAELGRRLAGETADRPSLTGADPARESATVLAAREPLYRRLADHEVDVTSLTPQQAAEAVRRLVAG